jgi:hypothetical protein
LTFIELVRTRRATFSARTGRDDGARQQAYDPLDVTVSPEAGWWSERGMRASPAEYLGLKLRAHDLLYDVPLYDVSVVDLPGGGAGRSVADIRALESSAPPSRIATVLYGVRHFFGRLFGWDRRAMQPEESLLPRLTERDWMDSVVPPGTQDGSFLVLYQFPDESLSETLNAMVHGFICTALAHTETGYRLYWGIYVRPVSWLTRPYLIAIEPFRRILYPPMLRRIQRAWLTAYGGTP